MKTVEKALAVLESFTEASPWQGVSEIARRLDLPKASVHGMLRALRGRGYVIADGRTHKYALGFKMVQMAERVLRRYDLREICLPLMQELAASCREDVSLSVPAEGQWVIIEIVRGPQFVRQNTRVGMALPLYCGSGGRCMLAFMSQEEADEAIRRLEFHRFTANTLSDERALRADLHTVRARGYAEGREEYFPEAAALAFPLLDGCGRVLGACTIHSTVSRITEESRDQLVRLGRETSAAMNAALRSSG